MPAAAPAAVTGTTATTAATTPAGQSSADDLAAAQSQIAQARAFGVAGTVLGLIGLGLALWALSAARRSNGPVATTTAARPTAA